MSARDDPQSQHHRKDPSEKPLPWSRSGGFAVGRDSGRRRRQSRPFTAVDLRRRQARRHADPRPRAVHLPRPQLLLVRRRLAWPGLLLVRLRLASGLRLGRRLGLAGLVWPPRLERLERRTRAVARRRPWRVAWRPRPRCLARRPGQGRSWACTRGRPWRRTQARPQVGIGRWAAPDSGVARQSIRTGSWPIPSIGDTGPGIVRS
jgi:hypothetical protein